LARRKGRRLGLDGFVLQNHRYTAMNAVRAVNRSPVLLTPSCAANLRLRMHAFGP
jgi:hypothetical protein